MRGGIGVAIGWFGFGVDADWFPALRLGPVMVFAVSGTALDRARKWADALTAARDALRR